MIKSVGVTVKGFGIMLALFVAVFIAGMLIGVLSPLTPLFNADTTFLDKVAIGWVQIVLAAAALFFLWAAREIGREI